MVLTRPLRRAALSAQSPGSPGMAWVMQGAGAPTRGVETPALGEVTAAFGRYPDVSIRCHDLVNRLIAANEAKPKWRLGRLRAAPCWALPFCSVPWFQATASSGAEVGTAAQVTEDLFCKSKRKRREKKAGGSDGASLLVAQFKCSSSTAPSPFCVCQRMSYNI